MESPFKEQYSEWYRLYSDGMSAREIATIYGRGVTTVARVIARAGISRSAGEAARLRDELRTKNDPRPEYHYFDNIDSEEKAYWLGMLLADGSVSYTKGAYSVTFKLKEEDAYMVERLANTFNTSTKRVASKINGIVFPARVCHLNSKYLCNRLIELGVRPRKSVTGRADVFDNISEELMPPFLRGLIDGDGSLYIRGDGRRCAISIYGSIHIVQRIKEELLKLGINNNKVVKNTSIYMTAWAKYSDLAKIIHYLYDNPNIYLTRKYDIAQRILGIIGGDCE